MKTASTVFAPSFDSAEMLAWAAGLGLTVGLWFLLVHGQMDLLFALVIFGVLLIASLRDSASGAVLTLVYLLLMGDIRRIVAASFGQPKLDLLLLIAPAIALFLALPLLVRVRLKESLSKAMLLLLVVMIIEVFNPQQGGLTVGISGALFYIAPVLWFWIGRRFCSPRVAERLLYYGIYPLALLAAVMGLCQTFIGFLPYQQTWIQLMAKSYSSLHVGGSIRAFGFSVSGAEYATLVAMSATGVIAAFFASKRLWVFAFPLFLTAMILASARNLVIKLIFALAVVWTLRAGKQLSPRALFRVGLFASVGLAAVMGLASRFSSSTKPVYEKNAAAQNALEHQAGGFAHPFDKRFSTAGVHSKMLANGIAQGFTSPLGHGLGATTGAVKKFGGGTDVGSSEVDFSDMFISLGLVGGLTYAYIIFITLMASLRYVQRVDRSVSLPVLALLATTASAWLIPGQYSISSIVFFLIGALVYEGEQTGPPISRVAIDQRSSAIVMPTPLMQN